MKILKASIGEAIWTLAERMVALSQKSNQIVVTEVVGVVLWARPTEVPEIEKARIIVRYMHENGHD
jgi:hypothetical protein